MSDISIASVESLIAEWHMWANSVAAVMGIGYPAMTPTARLAKFSKTRQSDDDLSDDLDHASREADLNLCDRIISGMHPQLRIAISLKARSLATGAAVWQSPRLPASRREVERLQDEAISVFRRQWQSRYAS